jgi:hypothetical protein
MDRLKDVSFRYAVTGSLAAGQVAPIAAPRLATIYVERTDAAASALGLRPADTAANVVLAEPYDDVVFDRAWTRSGITYVALSQVAADLLTGPGRGPAEGAELLDWLGKHEDAWRT